jgi:hypothetical protein
MWEIIKANPTAALALLVSAGALGFSFYNFVKTRTATLYSDIDARYHDLLKMGITNPEFVNPALTKEYHTQFEGDALLKYQRYAFAAWNIVETIVDRGGNSVLAETWFPVIKEENRLHRRWLNHPENQEKFKNSFLKFMIENREMFPCPSCQALGDNRLCPRCQELSRIS